jgi:hypothetical protein
LPTVSKKQPRGQVFTFDTGLRSNQSATSKVKT